MKNAEERTELADLAREMLILELEVFEIKDYKGADSALMDSSSTTSCSTSSSCTSCTSCCG